MYVENCNINLKCFIFLDLSIMALGRRGSLFKMFCSMRWSLRAVSPPLPLLVLVARSPPLVSSSSSNSRTWRWTHLGRIQGTACFGTHPCSTKPISMNIHNIPFQVQVGLADSNLQPHAWEQVLLSPAGT